MVNLLNPELRSRDIRKLVEPHLYEVNWDFGVDETSEWVIASCENETYKQRLLSWLSSKNIPRTENTIVTDTGWSTLQHIVWSKLLEKPDEFFNRERVLVIASDRSWVIEYAPQQVIRFGRWV